MKRWWIVITAIAVCGWSTAGRSTQDPNAPCLGCHGDAALETTLADGSRLSLWVDAAAFARSIHGDQLACTDCHSVDLATHPDGTFSAASRRHYTLSRYETCKQCHFSNYTKLLESVHYDMLAQGKLQAPICVDCHGYHDVEPPNRSRQGISRRCAACHDAIYQTYATSVHGRALVEENNQDVPVCTDCHQAHNIQDPRSTPFRLQSPTMCGHCHANATLMAQYGLSTDVLQTYLRDFHGVSTQVHQQEAAQGGVVLTAGCVDCHGVHNITKTDAPNSTVMKSNLVQQCRRCHTTASDNFPDAWLSHYEPTWEKAPLVYTVKIFYRFFIPFIIGGLVLHILLHIWRVIVNR